MRNKKTDKKRKDNGLTIVELLIVIAIMGIFASVVYASLSAGKKKTQAESILQSMSSIAPLAYKCLTKGTEAAKTTLSTPPGGSVCSGYTGTPSFSAWPDISKSNWSYSSFYWCAPGYSGTDVPSSCSPYSDGSCGGDWTNKKFCYLMKETASTNCSASDARCIWCTDNGCQKSGF